MAVAVVLVVAACVGEDPKPAPVTPAGGSNDGGGALDSGTSSDDASTPDADAGPSDPDGGERDSGRDAGAGTYAAEILADAPLAYWRLGETSGTSAKNIAQSGAAYDLTLAGVTDQLGRESLVAGEMDTSIFFSAGLSATVPLGASTALLKVTNAFSIDGWVKLSASASGAAMRTVFSSTSGSSDGFSFMIDGGSGSFFLACHGHAAYSTTTVNVPIDGKPHYIAVSWVGAASSATFHVDGVSEAVVGIPDITLEYKGTAARVGAWPNGTLPFEGIIDELAIYPVALAPERVDAHRKH